MGEETFFQRLLVRFGGAVNYWPWYWRLILPVMLCFAHNRRAWQEEQQQEHYLGHAFQSHASELAVEPLFMQRLQDITALPQHQPHTVEADIALEPRWFAYGIGSALASVFLGVAIGVSTLAVPLFGDSVLGDEIGFVTATSELPVWLEGE